MSKCLKCGAALPPVGECPACAAVTSPPATPTVPSLLDKDIQIDRRHTPESTPAVSGALPGLADRAPGPTVPPGMTPRAPAMPQAQRIPTPPAMPQVQAAPPPSQAPTPAPDASSRLPPPVPVVTFAAPSRLPPPLPSEEMASGMASEELMPRLPLPTLPPREAESSTVPTASTAQASSALPTPPRPRAASAAPRASTGVREIHARPASLWRRLLSFTIDTSTLLGVAALYITLASAIAGVRAPSSQGLTLLDSIAAWMHALESILLPGLFLMLVLAVFYGAVAAFLWNGRTLGRMLLGLRLVDTHGLAPEPTRAIVRALLSVVSFVLFLGGFWMALFDRRGQTLHDKLTSTFVVQPS